ncbi:MAG: undecaprenyl/decaprenyl-phosphate alpha-N-acetylglucosaminyl 1-phosphate transferase [Bacteroidia bacterium]|nr:undecaprenyl/decaprenyl-phosphate alpha-N-acetylglucosaminyl 1-phosphate transferase [Bacteroidia bacterium]
MNSVFLIIFFIYTVFLCFLVNWFLLNRSNRYILKKANISGIRWGSQTKPVVGGIGFYTVFLFSVINYFFYFGKETVIDFKSIGILLVITLSFLMGLADDIINTSPYFKLIVQLLCAVILIYFGIYIDVSPHMIINYIITVLWVVGIMNSFNILDNMDAITAMVSISIIIGIITGIAATHKHIEHFYLFICIGIFAALLCFLYYNWHPARMYMGDNGSQFLGAMMSVLGILFFWNANRNDCYCYNSKQFITVALAFIVPLIDTTSVTINRLLKKKSPFVGGKDHTTHHLNYLGLSPRIIAVLLFCLSSVSVAASVYITYFLKEWSMAYFYIFGAIGLLFFIAIYSITRISKPPPNGV